MAKGSENKNTLKEHQTIYSSQKVKKKPTKKKTASQKPVGSVADDFGYFSCLYRDIYGHCVSVLFDKLV